MKRINYFLLILFVMFFVSCQKQEAVDFTPKSGTSTQNSTIKIDSTLGFPVLIKHNTLCFPNKGDAYKAMDILGKMSSEKRRNWENLVGFTSFQSIYEVIQNEIEQDEKGEKFNEIVIKYKSYITRSSESYLSIKPRVFGQYAYISNSIGYFISEAYVNKVMDGKMYTGYLYDLPAIAAKSHEGEAKSKYDLSKFDIQITQLEKERPENLKSLIDQTVSPTRIWAKLKDKNAPDKMTNFELKIENYYVASSLAEVQTWTKHYYIVYYYCDYDPYSWDCDDCPGGYSGYSDFGTWFEFVESSGGYWQVEVPFEGYFDNMPWNKPPDGEYQTYITELYEKRYYNWTGRIDVIPYCYTEHINWGRWKRYDGTVTTLSDIRVSVRIGFDNNSYSSEVEGSISPIWGNPQGSVGYHLFGNTNITVYYFTLSKYEYKPSATFKCVTGIVTSRFCTELFVMNFNF